MPGKYWVYQSKDEVLSAPAIKAAEVDIVENGRTVHYKMSDVIVSSVSKASSGGERPMESVSCTYQKVEMTK